MTINILHKEYVLYSYFSCYMHGWIFSFSAKKLVSDKYYTIYYKDKVQWANEVCLTVRPFFE